MKLSVLATLLGAAYALPNIYGLANPKEFAAKLQKFPRSLPAGILLMLLGTAWFVYFVHIERNSDFAHMKPMMMAGFATVGICSCVYLQDFLAVRGWAVSMLLLAKVMLDTQRWYDTPWRLVIGVWAYVMICVAVWFTVSPWRCRDWIQWNTANKNRLRVLSAVRAAFGLFVVGLGLTVFR